MKHYADSSFLVSCYVADANNLRAKAWLLKVHTALPFTALHSLEVRNALKLGVFRGLFTEANAAAAWKNLEKDLRAARLRKTVVNWPTAFRIAARYSEVHAAVTGTRSLDILHVAVAKTLHATNLVSFDIRQCTLASVLGLDTSPQVPTP